MSQKHEIKSVFHCFQRTFTEVNKIFFFEGESLTLRKSFNRKLMKFLIERNILNNVTLIVHKSTKYSHLSVYKKKSQQTFTCVKKVQNMFQVCNKDTRVMSNDIVLMSILLTLKIFCTFFKCCYC